MRGSPDPRTREGHAGDARGEMDLVRAGHAAAHVADAIAAIRARTALVPRAAVILGSGLGPVAEAVSLAPRGAEIATAEVPFWPHSTVAGHAGRLVLGWWNEVPVALLSGRSHRYEGYGLDSVTFSVRVFHALGARLLFLTNAVGSINPRLHPGSLMLVRDHVNFHGTRGLFVAGELGAEPTPGASLERAAARPTPVYSERLAGLLLACAREKRVPLAQGVLMGGLGPAYETAAEVAAARRWGADAACMSTVTEALVGAGLGLEVAAVSCVTNLATGLAERALTHAEVIEVSDRAAAALGVLLGEALGRA